MSTVEILADYKKEWEESDLDKIVSCWENGWSYQDIAYLLDVEDAEVVMALLHLDQKGKLNQREKGILGTTNNDCVEYDVNSRIRFNELLHFNQGELWTEDDTKYLCKYHEIDGLKSISLCLGRTSKSVAEKLLKLKKNGKYDYYRNLNS